MLPQHEIDEAEATALEMQDDGRKLSPLLGGEGQGEGVTCSPFPPLPPVPASLIELIDAHAYIAGNNRRSWRQGFSSLHCKWVEHSCQAANLAVFARIASPVPIAQWIITGRAA